MNNSKYYWSIFLTRDDWEAHANKVVNDLTKNGFGRCKVCTKEWRRSKEAKRQRKHRDKLIKGNSKKKPWIYPREVYFKGTGSICRIHKEQKDRNKVIERATPAWADLDKIALIYEEAHSKGMHADHIIPLQGDSVSGLHVEYNLKILPKNFNLWKSNRLLSPYKDV